MFHAMSDALDKPIAVYAQVLKDSLKIARPDGITDAEWERLASVLRDSFKMGMAMIGLRGLFDNAMEMMQAKKSKENETIN